MGAKRPGSKAGTYLEMWEASARAQPAAFCVPGGGVPGGPVVRETLRRRPEQRSHGSELAAADRVLLCGRRAAPTSCRFCCRWVQLRLPRCRWHHGRHPVSRSYTCDTGAPSTRSSSGTLWPRLCHGGHADASVGRRRCAVHDRKQPGRHRRKQPLLTAQGVACPHVGADAGDRRRWCDHEAAFASRVDSLLLATDLQLGLVASSHQAGVDGRTQTEVQVYLAVGAMATCCAQAVRPTLQSSLG